MCGYAAASKGTYQMNATNEWELSPSIESCNWIEVPVQKVLRRTDDWVLWNFRIFSVGYLWFSGLSGSERRILSYEFLKFPHYSCFWGEEIHWWHTYWATLFGWLWKSRSLPGSNGFQRYWWFCYIDFHNFFSIYVCEVTKSIADIPTKLSCLGDLENLDELPIQEVLRGFEDCILWNFTISSVFML